MLSISSALQTILTSRGRDLQAKIEVLWTDPNVVSGNTVETTDAIEASCHDPHLVDTKTTTPHKYIVLDGTTPISDGTDPIDDRYYLAPGTQQEKDDNQFGWYSSSVSDGDGEFITDPSIDVTFADPRPIKFLVVVGEPSISQYPVSFSIYIWDDEETLLWGWTYSNTEVMRVIDLSGEGINDAKKMQLVIREWSDTYTITKIVEFFGIVSDTLYDCNIVSINLLEEREVKNGALPIGNISCNEIDIELQNIKLIRENGEEYTDPFFPGNSASYLSSSITPFIKMVPYIGADVGGGTMEWICLGAFWTTSWEIDETSFSASVTARDRMDILRNVEFRLNDVLANKTLYQIAEEILDHAKTSIPLPDLTWSIDDSLKNYTIPYAWFGKTNYMEALCKIAEACLGQCYMSKEDKLIIESWTANATKSTSLTITRGQYFNNKQPIGSNVKNHIEVHISPIALETEASEIKVTDAYTFESGVSEIDDVLIEWGDDIYEVNSIEAFPVEVTGGISVYIKSKTFYPWGCLLSFSKVSGTTGTFKVKLTGKKFYEPEEPLIVTVDDEDSQLLYGKKDYVYKENMLMQDETIAQTIAARCLETYSNPRSEATIDWIGNPALELGDGIHVPVYTPNSTGVSVYDDFIVIRNRLDYDGGLRMTTSARKMITFAE